MTSFIVKFDSHQTRDAFVQRVAERQPRLKAHLYLPKRRPDAVVEDVSDDDEEIVSQLVGPDGKVFNDVEFKTMGPDVAV